MKVLVTRGGDEAETLVRILAARGHEAVAEPLFTIEAVELPAGELADALTGVQALLFTSANGVRAFAERSAERALPVFAVGDVTADAARAAGFISVESAQGNVEDLARLVAARLDPASGALFHGAASDVAGDLKGYLDERGFEVRRLVLYRARAAERLSEQSLRLFQDGALDAALFFSPRSGKTFVTLLGEKRSRDVCSGCHAFCLSPAVAAEIRSIDWAGVHVADQPNQEALLAALDGVAASGARAQPGSKQGAIPWSRDETKETMTDDTEQTQGDEGGDTNAERPALQIIAAFGGIRPMASKLGVAVSTVQGWRERAAIPKTRHDQIRAAAGRHAITLDPDLLEASALSEAQDSTADDQAALGVIVETAPAQASEATEIAPDSDTAAPTDTAGQADDRPQTDAISAGTTVTTPPPSAAAPPRRGGVGSFLLGAAVLAAGFVLAVLFRDVWLPYLPAELAEEQTAASDPAVDAIGQDVAGLKSELAALAAKIDEAPASGGAPDSGTSEALAAVDRQLTALDERMGEIETRPAGEGGGAIDTAAVAAVSESLESLNARIEAVEAAGGGSSVGSETLSADLAVLTARLDGLETAAAAPSEAAQAVTAGIATLRQDNATLGERLAAAEAALAAFGETETALEDSVAALKAATTSGRATASKEAALALALTQLRDGLRNAGPYAAELAQVRTLVEGDPALVELLQPLSSHARSGVATEAVMRREFPAVARAAVAAARGDAEEGLLSGVLRRVSSVVTVRPIGEVEGEGPGAIVARAESRLEVGDFAGAVAEVRQLSGAAAITAESWLSRAEARIAADAAISALAAEAIAKLAAAGG